MNYFSAFNKKLSGLQAYILADKKRAFLWGGGIYTVLFLIYSAVAIFPVIIGSGSFMGADSIGQYYPFLLDFRRNVIAFLESIKSGNPELTMINFDYFFGADTIATTTFMFLPFLPYYGLSAFVPEAGIPLFYGIGTVLLSYLSGISFMALCRHFDKNMLWSGFFAVFYIFCGNFFYTAGLNQHFFYMFIGFPLMIIGIDRILTNKGWLLFVLSVAWVALSGIPFVVYTVPFVVIFAAIRVYFLYKGHYFRNLGKYFLRGALFTVLGLVIAVLPCIQFFTAYFSSMRSSGGELDILSLLIPSFEHLDGTLNGSLIYSTTGVCAAVLPAFLYMFTSGRGDREEKVHSLVMLALTAFPVVRFGLNAFQYDLCRWGFVPAALMCFMAASNMPKLTKIRRTERGMFLFVIITYAAGFLIKAEKFAIIFIFVMALINAVPRLRKLFIKLVSRAGAAIKRAFVKKSVVLLLVGSIALLALILAVVAAIVSKNYRIIPETLIAVAATVLVLCLASKKNIRTVSALALAVVYAVSGVIYVNGSYFDIYKVESSPALEAAAQLEHKENSFGRTSFFDNDCSIILLDRSGGLFDSEEMEKLEKKAEEIGKEKAFYFPDPYINNAFRFGIAEPAFFISVANSDYLDFLKRCGQDNASFYSKVDASGYSGKEVMYSLFGVDRMYSFLHVDRFYGITHSDGVELSDGSTVYFYENAYALPAGVTYDTITGEKEFISYNSAELPYAMMDSVYLEGYETSEYNGKTYSEECDITLRQELRGETIFGIECYDNYITPETDLTGKFVYLCFEGVDCRSYEGAKHEIFTIDTGKEKRNFLIHNANSNWEWKYYSDQYTFSLGFCEENIEEISFISPFAFESVRLYAVPEEVYTSAYENSTAEILENMEISTNTITGDITVSSDKVLCLNMFYSDGWTAYIDGEKAPVYKANGMFMGIPLTKGSHTVRLSYRTPWLYESMIISTVSLAAAIAVKLIEKRRQKTK